MKVLLFDIDGTLISSGGAGSMAFFRALGEEFGLEEIRGEVPFSGRTDRAILRDLFHLHDLEDNVENWHTFRASYLKHLPRALVDRQGRVLPGVIELLDALAARDDLALGLLTGNTQQGAQTKLGHFGIDHHFAFGGFGDEHYHRDDVAREALAAAKAHLLPMAVNGDVWVIGDTPHDITCSRAIGGRCVAVATGVHPAEELAAVEPDLLLDDLSDLSALLTLWE